MGEPMTTDTESASGATDGGATSRARALLWGSFVRGATAWSGVRRRVHRNGSERGDVPGWVLVTLMTAGLVTALWVLAGDALGRVFEEAISSVTGP